MGKSKVGLSIFSLFLVIALILSGCSSKRKEPQEALKSSMVKAAEMKSYSFKGSMNIEDLDIQAEGDSADDAAAAAAILSTVKNMDLSWTGVYRADPMMMEMTLSLAIKGDMAINFNIPVVMTKEKVWVKIPNIPMIPLPEDVVGKFLELDLKKLAEESGEPIPNIDPGKSQQLANDVLGIIFKNVDEKQYLSDVKAKDAGVPDDAGVKQVIQFKVTKDQVEPFVQVLIEKIAPEILDLFASNAEYRDMIGMKQADIDNAKKELEDAKKEDVSEGMDEFKKSVKSMEVVANIGIDGNEYPAYTDVRFSMDVNAEGQSVKAAAKIVSQMKDINKDVSFSVGQPKAEDIVTMEQFGEQMGGLFGGADFSGEDFSLDDAASDM